MAKERNLIEVDRRILSALIAARKDDAKANLVEKVVVNEPDGMPVGLFRYKRKGAIEEKRLYFISETVDGELRNIIYDEDGRPVAWQEEEEDMVLQVAGDVKLDRTALMNQLILADERARKGLPAPGIDGENKAGEGRSLGKNEHETKQEDKARQEEKKKEEESKTEEKSEEQKSEEEEEQSEEGQENKQLRNLKYEINIDKNPRIRLDDIINGHYLWEILQLDDKLKDRLPEGLDPTSFRTGFLSFVDSHELDLADEHGLSQEEIRDLKPRESKETFVIQTTSGDIVELDESILKKKKLGTNAEKQRAEQSTVSFEKGKEAEKPKSNMEATRTSLFEIPDVARKFNVGENWYLEIKEDLRHKRTGEIPTGGHTKNISILQISRGIEYRLRSIDEPRPITREELRMQNEIIRKDPAEAEKVRAGHTKGLVDRCFKRYPSLGEYYNRNDITRKVEEYHNQGASDEQVLEQIGKNVAEAGKTARIRGSRNLPWENGRWH